MSFQTSDFDYDLPDRLIAQEPAEHRDESRLLVLNRQDSSLSHRSFKNLLTLLQPSDLLVVNDTRVLPARFFMRRATGGMVEGLFLHRTADHWQVMLRNASRCKPGESLQAVGQAGQQFRLLENLGRGEWQIEPEPEIEPQVFLDAEGITPLPPYIRRDDDHREAQDRPRYQTVYAANPGAVAAPTAGLHFTDALLQGLHRKGVEMLRVTLHVGVGTFAPVKAEDLGDHDMHREYYELSEETAQTLNAAKKAGRRIIAVGTTSVRVLESVARRHEGTLVAETGWSELFLYPPADFHIVDAMITNFHLPKSTLLMLVAAFCAPGGTTGLEMIRRAYQAAIENDYRFYSYGDAMLIQ